MFVKPKAGINVRDPVSLLHIPESGVEVPEESYWLRCLRSGDVVRASPPLVTAPASVVSPKQIPDSKGGK